MANSSNLNPWIVFGKVLSPDIELRIPKIRKAEQLLGFKSKVDLDEGICRTVAWYWHDAISANIHGSRN